MLLMETCGRPKKNFAILVLVLALRWLNFMLMTQIAAFLLAAKPAVLCFTNVLLVDIWFGLGPHWSPPKLQFLVIQ